MRTITFYAYKGGTGRTLALAKAANFLADDGHKVFIVDLDLEAPGLHFKLFDGMPPEDLCPGFVELAHSYVYDGYFPPMEDHAVRIKRSSEKGEIRLMPAGRALAGDYWKALTRLHWQELFEKDIGDGVPLFLELQERIEETFHPDILLIDARTGVTEVGGAALTLLPDDVVCLFSNNPESKWGTREAIRAIARTRRKTSQKPVRIVPVLTRFPPDEEEDEKRVIEEELKPYFNEPAADGESAGLERIFVLHSDRSLEMNERHELEKGGLKEDYDKLFSKGLGLNLPELARGRLREEAQRARESEEALTKWAEVLEGLLQDASSDPAAVGEAVDGLASASSALKRYDDALPLLRRVIELEGAAPARRAAAQHLALALARLGRFEEISAQIVTVALAPEGDEERESTAQRMAELVREYEEATGRYRSYQRVVLGLGERQEAADSAADAERTLRAGIHYFEPWGDEGMASILPIRHRLANLLKKVGRLADAKAELDTAIREHRRIGRPPVEKSDERAAWQALSRQLKEDLASVLEAQHRIDAAEAVRRRLVARPPARTPVVRELPPRRTVPCRAGPQTASFEIPLRLVTPLLGGAAETREIDGVDVLRAPSIRGHLRFWWRALHGGRLSSEELYEQERRLWGGAGDENGGRSTVEIRVAVHAVGELDTSDVVPYGRNETEGAYALWPARATRGRTPQPQAPRRKPGTRFSLAVTCHAGDESEVRAAVRAWILFGGYGGRTRRGAGSLTVDGRSSEQALWLPASDTREALREIFLGQDILEPIPARPLADLPLLGGAGLRTGSAGPDAMAAWITALHWLRDFRQMQPASGAPGAHDPSRARDRGDSRPGRSNWPEADKVRQLSPLPGRGAAWAHRPLHNAEPAWPRAGFGLPIVAQFQRIDRKTRQPYPPPGEPPDFELRWRERGGKDQEDEVHDRLASPLIVKALPLAGGRFAPCALWLHRGYPKHGEVIVIPSKGSRPGNSAAPFDRLVATGDTARYAPLAGAAGAPEGTRLRKAFFDWLAATHRSSIHTVAP